MTMTTSYYSQIRAIWIMAVLQGLNVIFFGFEAIYMFTPWIWIIFGMIFFEGLLGGGAVSIKINVHNFVN